MFLSVLNVSLTYGSITSSPSLDHTLSGVVYIHRGIGVKVFRELIGVQRDRMTIGCSRRDVVYDLWLTLQGLSQV